MKLKTIYLSTGEMEDTPAAIDRENGVLYINPKRWFKLTPFQRKFVKYHEYGHLNLDTDSELLADEYAFNKLAGTEFRSLKQCIECLETLLDEKLIGHKVRVDQMYKLATEWDKKHKGDKKLNKGTGAQEIASQDYVTDLLTVSNTSNIKQLQSMFSGMQSMLNSLLITAVLIVAMIFLLKDEN